MLRKLKTLPDVVELHRAIDAEETEYQWGSIPEIKALAEKLSTKMLIAVAGGVRVDNIGEALGAGAGILVVGRAITNAKDVYQTAEMFIEGLAKEEIDQFRVMTDF
jgi:bifunctional enzyme Fae/Hps